ncbi:MAG: DEAD/DEAH box helicase [Pseudonocardia sp.]|nr:DEAD/DEAH box helicase [Pseudonocardia sp.]
MPVLLALPDGRWPRLAERALRLVAAGRIEPSVSPSGIASWRVLGEHDDRDLLDAVADALPRSSGAEGPYAGTTPRRVDAVEAADQASISLRVDAPRDPALPGWSAVVQVHVGGAVADAAQLWAARPAGFAPRHRIDAVLAIRRAAEVWAPLHGLLSRPVPDAVDLDDGDLAELLETAAAALTADGVPVHWPREMVGGLAARVVVGREADGPGIGAEWGLSLRGSPLTPAELDELAASRRPVVRLRGEWTLVAPALSDRAGKRELAPLGRGEALGAALGGTLDVDGTAIAVDAEGWVAGLREALGREPEPVEVPRALTATLRDYQLRGLHWLARTTGVGLGACLADDMGLGKTVTVIALHLHRAAADPTLIVCPASLLGTWEREFARFAPGTPVLRFHGTERTLPERGVVLTTYGTLRSDPAPLTAHTWDLVVADEAQNVKNPRSETARALRGIDAVARVALTGTPVENRLTDLWAILDWATPGLLGAPAAFRRRWAEPIESGREPERAADLARLVAPFLLRRRKTDPGIAPELPARTETDTPVGLTREQAGLYTAAVAELTGRVEGSEGIARRGAIGALLTALKQICNHPAQYLGETDGPLTGRSGKLDALDELLDALLDARPDGGVLVFTQYVTMARLLQRHLAGRGIGTRLLHGGTPVARRTELVDEFQAGGFPVFLLSLRAAGTGLTLTRADHVVHYDRWWNPAVEDQATDRAHRIGQTRAVQVHRLVAEGTLEDRIATMLREKRALADSVLSSGVESALTGLSDADLAELVALRS